MNATSPLLLMEVSKPKKLNSSAVLAMVVSFLPSPRKMASVSSFLPPSSLAAKETWPESFIEGLKPMIRTASGLRR